jgi:formylglycine-generating enzyme required for sulfatase activity
MQILKSAIILVFLACALASCSKKPTLINGQIFVVTQGGENIKMGAVPVRVIPQEQFKEIARKTVPEIERQWRLERTYWASREVRDKLVKELKALQPSDLKVPELEKLIEAAENEESLPGLKQAPGLSEIWLKAFAEALPPTQIQTDADGRFTAEVESKVWLVAGGQRYAAGNTENYLWVQSYEPPAKGLPQPVLISNQAGIDQKEELHALLVPLVENTQGLEELESPSASSEVVQWAAKLKEQALKNESVKKMAESRAKAEAERRELPQKAEAERREIPQKLLSTTAGSLVNLFLTDTLAQSYVLIPAGKFMMGSPSFEEGRSTEENQVEVTISKPFWLAKTEVTQIQWEVVMGSNPSLFEGPNLPVENVSWEDAHAYLAKLNERGIVPGGWVFALPTEAQWEYACRAGEKGPFSGGSLDEVGWYKDNSGSKTHAVGMIKPNAWGLHDMHGNVVEWCADWSGTLKGGVDPTGPLSGFGRVYRGGSWNVGAPGCRAADRPGVARYGTMGFRPAIVRAQ